LSPYLCAQPWVSFNATQSFQQHIQSLILTLPDLFNQTHPIPVSPCRLFVAGIFVSVFTAYGIGANDIANAFGTSVGSKAITLWQAVIIGSICEFVGAMALGAG
jgi:hypothetical protein